MDAATRPHVLDLSLPRASRVERLPHGRQGGGVLGGPRVLGDLRRPSDRDRREDRQGALAQDRFQLQGRAAVQRRAAGREGQGHSRSGDQRVRRQLLGGRVRRPHRQRDLALQDRAGARRTRQRDVARRFLDARRCAHLGDRLLRSGHQSDVLGHGQSESRLERWPQELCRQPLWRLGRRARRRYRKAEVVLPVHAERRVRLGFGAGSRACDDRVAGEAEESDALGQSQWLLLRARSRRRPVPVRQGVREAELEPRVRQRPPGEGARGEADARRHGDLSGHAGWHELVLTVVQSADRPVLRLRVGQLLGDLDLRRGASVETVHEVHGPRAPGRRQRPRRGPGGWRPCQRVEPDGSRRLWRGPRPRSENRRKEVGVQDGRLHRSRCSDDRDPISCSRAAAKATSSPSTRARASCCGEPISAARSPAVRSPSR